MIHIGPTIADLPSAAANLRGWVFWVNDGASPSDASTGSGSYTNLVAVNAAGSAWEVFASLGIAPAEKSVAPGDGWANTSGTATLFQPSADLHYWSFANNVGIHRIEWTGPLPDSWAGRTLDAIDIAWATNGTITTNMKILIAIYDYIPGTDLITSAGNTVYSSGSAFITPTGTANMETVTTYSPASAFSAGAKNMRILFDRRGDSNAQTLKITSIRLKVS